jgi:2-polyprenyl-6-methoxyphenol hydroxylase-like FAD-dependent oxidoreductase
MSSSTLAQRHAVIIGGSIAGLLAARAVSPHFEKVFVLEKDVLPDAAVSRDGVPQGKHIHVLLPGGLAALDRLFPGCTAELVRNGSQRFDYGLSQFYIVGKWMPRIETNLHTVAQTRPFLEHHIRRWVSENCNVCIISEASVTNLLWDQTRTCIVGVALRRAGTHEELRSELVIDATGCNTRLPRWLLENGYPSVPEETIGIDLGYATGRFRVPDRLRPTHPMLYIVGPPPHKTRVGVRVVVENEVVYGAVGGYHGDHPPGDLKGFLEFARSLSQPDIFDVLSQAELLSPIVRYRIPSSRRRYYAKMGRFPRGLLPLGDSICNFDPAFGQGMTVAAQEAEALADSLAQGSVFQEATHRYYFKRIDSIVNIAWDLCSGENFKYPQTSGRRSLLFPLTRRYKDRVATCEDPKTINDFYRLISLTAPLRILLHPRVMLRALSPRSAA